MNDIAEFVFLTRSQAPPGNEIQNVAGFDAALLRGVTQFGVPGAEFFEARFLAGVIREV